MTIKPLNFVEGVLVNQLTSSDATFLMAIDKKYQKNDGTYYDLVDDITGVITANGIEVEFEHLSTKQVELARVSTIVSAGATSDGRPKYTCTIETNGATKLRGLANSYDGTNSVDNVITDNIITTFPQNSKVKITVNTGQIQRLVDLFTSNSTQADFTAGEAITTDDSVSLHTDGKIYKYDSATYPALIGIALTSGSGTVTVAIQGYLYTGLSALTIGEYLYAEDTGALTQTISATTKVVGTAMSATTARIGIPLVPGSSFSDTAFEVFESNDGTITLKTDLSGATTGKSVTLASNHTDDREHILPDADGTLLSTGLATVEDSIFKIDGGSGKLIFDASGLSADRVWTVEDVNTTIGNPWYVQIREAWDLSFLANNTASWVEMATKTVPTGKRYTIGEFFGNFNANSPGTTRGVRIKKNGSVVWTYTLTSGSSTDTYFYPDINSVFVAGDVISVEYLGTGFYTISIKDFYLYRFIQA